MSVTATGNVVRLYVRKNETFVRLGNTNDVLPKDGYFRLSPTDHANYNALYSLALAAAINGYDLLIRATGEITPEATAEIDYLVVDW